MPRLDLRTSKWVKSEDLGKSPTGFETDIFVLPLGNDLFERFALKHDFDSAADFFSRSPKKICQEKLSDITRVVTAELKMHPINGQNYMWYEPSFVKEIKQNIDLLIIDGPPRIINKNARFPAIPLLKEYFTDDTVILLDDGRRKDEQNTVKLWLKELDKFNVDYFNTEKGTFKLSKIEEYGQNKHGLEILNE